MKFRKRVLNGLELAEYVIRNKTPGDNTCSSPWPGLVIRFNTDITGFTIINESNAREIAYINLLSAYGRMYTAYRLLSLPASYQKKDQQCVPIEMGKPECGRPVSCNVRPILHNDRKYERTEWIGGRSGQAGYPLLSKHHRGVLIYDDQGVLQQGGMGFEMNLTYGADSASGSKEELRAPLWLHGLPNHAVATVKEWYASIYEVIDKIEMCDVDKRGMLTLAAKAYTAYYNASKKITGSKLVLLPMTYNERNNSPFGEGNFCFAAADHNHYLGLIKKGNWCKLPKIVLIKQDVVRDEYRHPETKKMVQTAHDVLTGEIAVIPPVGCYGLKWKHTSSVGDRGTSGTTVPYTSLTHAELCRNDDDYLRKQGASGTDSPINDKYTALKEPWRDFLALKHDSPEEQELSTYNRSVDADDLQTIMVRARQRNHISYTKECVIRGMLHDFDANPNYLAVKKILIHEAGDLPRAVHIDNLANSMVAEQVVNQLPLS